MQTPSDTALGKRREEPSAALVGGAVPSSSSAASGLQAPALPAATSAEDRTSLAQVSNSGSHAGLPGATDQGGTAASAVAELTLDEEAALAAEDEVGDEADDEEGGEGDQSGQVASKKRAKRVQVRGCADSATYDRVYGNYKVPAHTPAPLPASSNAPTEAQAQLFLVTHLTNICLRIGRLPFQFALLVLQIFVSWTAAYAWRHASLLAKPNFKLLRHEALRSAKITGLYLRLWKSPLDVLVQVEASTRTVARDVEIAEGRQHAVTDAAKAVSQTTTATAFMQYGGMASGSTMQQRADTDLNLAKDASKANTRNFKYALLRALHARSESLAEAEVRPIVEWNASLPLTTKQQLELVMVGLLPPGATVNAEPGGRPWQRLSPRLTSPIVAEKLRVVLAQATCTSFCITVLRDKGVRFPAKDDLLSLLKFLAKNEAMPIEIELRPTLLRAYESAVDQRLTFKKSDVVRISKQRADAIEQRLKLMRAGLLKLIYSARVGEDASRAVIWLPEACTLYVLVDALVDQATERPSSIASVEVFDLDRQERVFVYGAAAEQGDIRALRSVLITSLDSPTDRIREASPAKVMRLVFWDGAVRDLTFGFRSTLYSREEERNEGLALALALSASSLDALPHAYDAAPASATVSAPTSPALGPSPPPTPSTSPSSAQQAKALGALILQIAKEGISAYAAQGRDRGRWALVGNDSAPLTSNQEYVFIRYMWLEADRAKTAFISLSKDFKDLVVRGEVREEAGEWRFVIQGRHAGASEAHIETVIDIATVMSPHYAGLGAQLAGLGFEEAAAAGRARLDENQWLSRRETVSASKRRALRLTSLDATRCGVKGVAGMAAVELDIDFTEELVERADSYVRSRLPSSRDFRPKPIIGRLVIPFWALRNTSQLETWLVAGLEVEGDLKWDEAAGGLAVKVRLSSSQDDDWKSIGTLAPATLQLLTDWLMFLACNARRNITATGSLPHAWVLACAALMLAVADKVRGTNARLLTLLELDEALRILVLPHERDKTERNAHPPAHVKRWRAFNDYALALSNAAASVPSIPRQLQKAVITLAAPFDFIEQIHLTPRYTQVQPSACTGTLLFDEEVYLSAGVSSSHSVRQTGYSNFEIWPALNLDLGLTLDAPSKPMRFFSVDEPCGTGLEWRNGTTLHSAFLPVAASAEMRHLPSDTRGMAGFLTGHIQGRRNPSAAREPTEARIAVLKGRNGLQCIKMIAPCPSERKLSRGGEVGGELEEIFENVSRRLEEFCVQSSDA